MYRAWGADLVCRPRTLADYKILHGAYTIQPACNTVSRTSSIHTHVKGPWAICTQDASVHDLGSADDKPNRDNSHEQQLRKLEKDTATAQPAVAVKSRRHIYAP